MNLPITPLSDEWEVPKGTGHKFLVQYLISEQTQAYGTFFKGLSNKVMLRNMKLLCQDYSEDDIKRVISWICRYDDKVTHPFSTALIKKRLQWLLDVRQCPIIQSYQNKS